MKHYYWVEWKNTWGLWVKETGGKRRVAYAELSPSGHYVSFLGSGGRWNGKHYTMPGVLWVSDNLEEAKGRCAAAVRFPDEGEPK
jgi:hypothetical protein